MLDKKFVPYFNIGIIIYLTLYYTILAFLINTDFVKWTLGVTVYYYRRLSYHT